MFLGNSFEIVLILSENEVKENFQIQNSKMAQIAKTNDAKFLLYIIFVGADGDYFPEVLIELRGRGDNFPCDFPDFTEFVRIEFCQKLTNQE